MKAISTTVVILIVAIVIGVILLFLSLGGTNVMKKTGNEQLCEQYIQNACRFGVDPSNFQPYGDQCSGILVEPLKTLFDECVGGDSNACEQLCSKLGVLVAP